MIYMMYWEGEGQGDCSDDRIIETEIVWRCGEKVPA